MTSHGMSYSKTYKSWKDMKQRCLNPNNTRFSHYGGRGIKVCPDWMDFNNFIKDMGECPIGMTLERIDNDSGYTPTNCKWIHWSEQNKNRSAFNTHPK